MYLILRTFDSAPHFKVLSAAALTALAVVSTGCGKNELLKSASGKTSTFDNGNLGVTLTTVWDTGDVSVPAVQFPIPNPNDTSQKIGSLALKPVFPTGAEVEIAIDFTSIADIDADDALLPNGTSIPIGGLGDTPVVGIPIADTKAKAYFALGSGIAVLGFAVPIREFDEIGRNTGQSNLFLPFEFFNVRGTGGLFAGPRTMQTGLGLFADIGKLIQEAVAPAARTIDGVGVAQSSLSSGASQNGAAKVYAAMQDGSGPRRAQFHTRRMSRRADQNLRQGLYNLHRRRAVAHPY